MLKYKELNKNSRTLFVLSMVLIAAGALMFVFTTCSAVISGNVISGISAVLPFVSIAAGVAASCVTCSKVKKLRENNSGVIISWMSYGVGVGTIIASAIAIAVTILGISFTLFFVWTIIKAIAAVI